MLSYITLAMYPEVKEMPLAEKEDVTGLRSLLSLNGRKPVLKVQT